VSEAYDLAVVGSAFAGSLTAMIARRLGLSVVLIERRRHPRFAIGESSTPLANLLLEELATRYDLPRLLPFAKWGSWRRAHPEIGCGLKRGFTFLHHEFGVPWTAHADRANELLVAASPSEAIADTHWFRPDFDEFFMREARTLGADYLDETELTSAEFDRDGALLAGTRHGREIALRARFVVDASGPRGFLHRVLGLGEKEFPDYPATQALYSHFTDVSRWDALFPSDEVPPFAHDDAALHQVFPGGWMWQLRFNNGITSVGVSVSEALARDLKLSEGEPAWDRLLAQLPSVARQFAGAKRIRDFTHLSKLTFRSAQTVGDRWALLPSAAGFVDPLLSTGFTLTLLGVERLAALLAKSPNPRLADLETYAADADADLCAAAQLIGALHRQLPRPTEFQSLLMLYFAAASFGETARRLCKPGLAAGFLLRDRRHFAAACSEIISEANAGRLHGPALISAVRQAVAPVCVGGWCDAAKRNWYGVDFAPLLAAAGRLGVSRAEILVMLRRAGVVPG
jgi:tetracycline 7-halogenase / FADH2 O2-dependent halogenase